MKKFLIVCILSVFPVALSQAAPAPLDRKEVRSGIRKMKKNKLKEAEISFRKALVKDSTSFAANYDLAQTIYKLSKGNPQAMAEAAKFMEAVQEQAAADPQWGDEFYFNLGDIALGMKDYKNAVEAFRQSLLRNPGDLEAKENYIYARKMLENQQNQQDQQNQDDKQDKQDQEDKEDQQQPQQQDQQDQQNQQDRQQEQPKDAQISPQAAQQLLQAIQDKEKETQEKVQAEKAAAAKSRQKEKNW